jgi:hypothetical protein
MKSILSLIPCALILVTASGREAAADEPVETIVPAEKKPFTVPTDPAARKLLQRQISEYMALPPAQVQAHPAAANFPGGVAAGSARVDKAITFQGWKQRWQSTGLYANAGEIVTVIPEGKLPARVTVEIRVGCHTDRLFRDEIKQWKRFPLITRTFPLRAGATPVANAFGGPLFILVKRAKSTDSDDFRFQLRFTNAVAAPFFVLGETSGADWEKARSNSAPWGELVGRNMILHFPADQIRKLADPTALLEWWDKVVATEDELVGWPTRTEQERVVPDRQISAGWMHSGYPFMCHLASAPLITDLEKLKAEGSWGFFHELGHNHQSKAWTFPGQGEVTVNFFSLYCMEKIVGRETGAGHSALAGEKLFKALDRRLGNPPSTTPFDQLAPFVVLLQKFGWTPMQQTLASYQTDPIDIRAPLETKEAEFVRRYSRNAKADLTSFFKAIGYTCPDSLCAEFKSLPTFDLNDWRKVHLSTGKP